MSKTKEYYYDKEEEIYKFSNLLNLSFNDVERLEWDIETDFSEDGLVYDYRIVFSESSPKEILKKIPRLENGNTVYVPPWEFEENYDVDKQFEAITENKGLLEKFKDEISNLNDLNDMKVENASLRDTLNRQIFIGIIGTLEAFLSETFISLAINNDKYLKSFITSWPAFKTQKFELREILDLHEKLEDIAKHEMLSVIYHNLPKVRQMYVATFNIDFPDISEIYKSVLKRHDLVHRNGKTKDGDFIQIDHNLIESLINQTLNFVEEIAIKLEI